MNEIIQLLNTALTKLNAFKTTGEDVEQTVQDAVENLEQIIIYLEDLE